MLQQFSEQFDFVSSDDYFTWLNTRITVRSLTLICTSITQIGKYEKRLISENVEERSQQWVTQDKEEHFWMKLSCFYNTFNVHSKNIHVHAFIYQWIDTPQVVTVRKEVQLCNLQKLFKNMMLTNKNYHPLQNTELLFTEGRKRWFHFQSQFSKGKS